MGRYYQPEDEKSPKTKDDSAEKTIPEKKNLKIRNRERLQKKKVTSLDGTEITPDVEDSERLRDKKKFTPVSNKKTPFNKKSNEWFKNKKFSPAANKKFPINTKQQPRLKNQDIRNEFGKVRKKNMATKNKFAAKQTARSEFLLMEERGYIEAEDGEDTSKITQHQLAAAVDITTATKFFDLRLVQFGPYSIDYTRNGQNLLIGGRKGHVAAINWLSKRLKCEINVMEEIQAVKWLHQETMFAVAQKEWVYMYDNRGIELHCIKSLDRVLRMEFLPYHWLLATSNENGFLSWLDTSIGQIVVQYPTRKGRLDVMCQNPDNALLVLGHSTGVVTMWSPNQKEPTTSMLCHKHPVKAVAVDSRGQYMATAAIDRSLKIWDLRNNKTCIQSYVLGGGANGIVFSQTRKLAATVGNIVAIYDDPCTRCVEKPLIEHRGNESILSTRFCPFEDVLGIGHSGGFTSIIVPGAGEANFDALEANPFQTKRQRGETEVKFLLDKIPSTMISEDSRKINKVNVASAVDKFEGKHELVTKAPKIDFTPRHKTKGRASSKKLFQKKQGVQGEHKRKFFQNRNLDKRTNKAEDKKSSSGDLLSDRFKSKVN